MLCCSASVEPDLFRPNFFLLFELLLFFLFPGVLLLKFKLRVELARIRRSGYHCLNLSDVFKYLWGVSRQERVDIVYFRTWPNILLLNLLFGATCLTFALDLIKIKILNGYAHLRNLKQMSSKQTVSKIVISIRDDLTYQMLLSSVVRRLRPILSWWLESWAPTLTWNCLWPSRLTLDRSPPAYLRKMYIYN